MLPVSFILGEPKDCFLYSLEYHSKFTTTVPNFTLPIRLIYTLVKIKFKKFLLKNKTNIIYKIPI